MADVRQQEQTNWRVTKKGKGVEGALAVRDLEKRRHV